MLDTAAVMAWLGEAKDMHSPLLSRCILFGSMLNNSFPNDVDIIIVSAEWDIRCLCRRLKSEFCAKFGLPLHIQLFHVSQSHDIQSFISRAGGIAEAP
jgi:hypothetical protein